MRILYEDKHLAVVLKPAGTPSQPDPSGREDMVTLLKKATGGDVFCVHRLDTATAGVMVYAKDTKTAGRLTEALSSPEARKEYLCVVKGEADGEGTMRDLLFHDKRKNKAYVTDRKRAGVKEAVLDYRTVAMKEGHSLVRVVLHTGRTHQIRVQFASRRLPLVGDGKYGSKDNRPLALQCVRLAFDHPFSKKRIDIRLLPDSPWYGFRLEGIEGIRDI